ncbi:MAG: DUF2779 domain-containing protein [Anaerolineaceae bacterium]|nr:DUF2779 domain-containing protein [Anaerolineaceae bacterium]
MVDQITITGHNHIAAGIPANHLTVFPAADHLITADKIAAAGVDPTLNYETYLAAIPKFDGYKPQQQMIFQYSLYKMESLHGEIYHTEHLSIIIHYSLIGQIEQTC